MMDREWSKPCMIKSINKTSTINRRKFDETFKREAVNNWISSGKAAAVIAQELGLKVERLYSWRKLFAPAPAPTSNLSSTSRWLRIAIYASNGTF
jgi:transposase-like protein